MNRLQRLFFNTPRVARVVFAAFVVTSISAASLFSTGAYAAVFHFTGIGTPPKWVVESFQPASSIGTTAPTGSTGAGQAAAGAHLPISYSIASLSGTVRYVATNGNDSGNGTDSSPYATLAKAYSAAAAGDTIVIRGGTYRQGNITIAANKPVRIIAYPGEIPVFNGATTASDGWTNEGSLQSRAYTAMPVTSGSGINFPGGQNLTGAGDGKFPDQAWVGSTQLKQVQGKGAVSDGTFAVEGGRLYMTASDVAKGSVEVSNLRNFMSIQAPGTTLEGIKVTRYSNSAGDYGVIKLNGSADKTLLKNVNISDTSFIAVTISGGSDTNNGTMFKNVTISSSNWMGVNPTYTDNLTFDSVDIHGMNQWGEFSYSPQSGAIKTSRTQHTKVLNSRITDNKSHGLWFDQSNYDVQVAGNTITGNLGSSVFFEISDNLTLANNYIVSPANGDRAVKLAGSSGLKLINNTIIGGSDPIGIYTDSRSKPGCADASQPLCANSYGSDRDSVHPHQATMDWVPRLDMMVNNIIAYPKGAGYCGVTTAVCITQKNGGANIPLSTIIHQADSLRPKTVISGNVYANGSGTIISTPAGKYTTPSAFSAAMVSAVNISGLEAGAWYGSTYVGNDGTPTGALTALSDQATAIPTDATINQYLPAGTKHYGVTFR